jgi:hypothetical protein
MEIVSIAIERRGAGSPCGTLIYQQEGRRASVLWLLQWRRGQKVTVEFVPGEGALREDLRAHHDRLVDAVTQAAFEHVSRKSLFT